MTAAGRPPRAATSRRRHIGRRLTGAYAYDRVAAALYEVIVDSVELGPCEVRAAQSRDWLRTAVARPIRVSCVLALETLRRELDRTFDAAPTGLSDWLDETAG
jgi:hypothetical protein